MSKAGRTMIIQTTIEYTSQDELGRVLDQIKRMAKLGVETYKQQLNNASFEYRLQFKQEHDIECEFIEHEGKTCIILQSKMNKQ